MKAFLYTLWEIWLWYLIASGLMTLGIWWIVIPTICWFIWWPLGVLATIATLVGIYQIDKEQ